MTATLNSTLTLTLALTLALALGGPPHSTVWPSVPCQVHHQVTPNLISVTVTLTTNAPQFPNPKSANHEVPNCTFDQVSHLVQVVESKVQEESGACMPTLPQKRASQSHTITADALALAAAVWPQIRVRSRLLIARAFRGTSAYTWTRVGPT